MPALLLAHALLLGWSAWCHSPVDAELGHLAAGLSHLRQGRFDLFRVNPPLVRTIAVLPVAWTSRAPEWTEDEAGPLRRPEFPAGLRFVRANGYRSFRVFTLARWACIPFSLLGGYACFRWANRLYGAPAGLMALALWCFSPCILGHASLITPDAHAAAMAVAACWAFWLWLRHPDWRRAAIAGMALGLAELTKYTLVVLYPLWPALWIVDRLLDNRKLGRKASARQVGMIVLMMAFSLAIINLGYGFEGSFQRLSAYRFESRALAGRSAPGLEAGNRLAGTWLGSLPVPLPRNYLQGIDQQKREFERDLWSYLRGRWQMGGWWYYYLYALAVKAPLGSWALLLLSGLVSVFGRHYVCRWRDEIVLLAPPAAVLALVSSQTGFSSHVRYVLPILPFAFVWVSKLARSVPRGHRLTGCAAGLALSWSILGSLGVYPHSLSYFNELAGGPGAGHAHLLESNIAWGQDLLYLARWLQNHEEARPLKLAYSGTLDPRLAGIDFTLPPVGPVSPCRPGDAADANLGPQPGWFAVDVNLLRGARFAVCDGQGGWRLPSSDRCDYGYFLRFRPAATPAYSIYVYHVTLEEANRVRRELGLPDPPPRNPTD